MLKSILTVLIVALMLLFVRDLLPSSTLPPQPVAIADILRNPAVYDGKPVILRGAVLARVSVFGVGAYRVGDPNGASILVLGLATAPAIGEQTEVSGVFRMAAALGDFQAPVVVAK